MCDEKLKWSILALAQSPDIQKQLVCSHGMTGEEIILEFSDAVDEYYHSQTDKQSKQFILIKELDDYILSKSRPEYEYLWLDDDYLISQEWEIIRNMAKKIAMEFKWDMVCPAPLYSAIYYA
ncbi:hypothetical protein [Alysiella crassa]|uniref:Uncharacterized protein n=1 Tax=Alysiella crassa TaxID=153491 RepID=A0A376BWX4_9NEIS|nr:hypothetical protein [Alysiella crassa]UOP06354.1 hypothetical protein LVJ80_11245 [Alysiella crassa]SSY80864.1 Uncharacterised protein [Alysiella crassa]